MYPTLWGGHVVHAIIIPADYHRCAVSSVERRSNGGILGLFRVRVTALESVHRPGATRLNKIQPELKL